MCAAGEGRAQAQHPRSALGAEGVFSVCAGGVPLQHTSQGLIPAAAPASAGPTPPARSSPGPAATMMLRRTLTAGVLVAMLCLASAAHTQSSERPGSGGLGAARRPAGRPGRAVAACPVSLEPPPRARAQRTAP